MNMIEIVARAVANYERIPLAWFHYRIAREAIAALREPSDAMLAAGVVHDDATYNTWIAMIDAALVEGE